MRTSSNTSRPKLLRERDLGSASNHGGRFASHVRTDGDVPLNAELTDGQALELALWEARATAADGGVWDADDTAQEALTTLLEQNSAARTAWTPQRVVAAVGVTTTGPVEPGDASMLLAVWITAVQGDSNRALTPTEIAALSRTIESDWRWRRRRPHGDVFDSLDVLSLSDPAVAAEAGALTAAPPADESEDWLEDEFLAGQISTEDVRRKAWNHFCPAHGLPRVPEGWVSPDEAVAVRASVMSRGGPIAVAAGMLRSDQNLDIDDLLFSAWPMATDGELLSIAEFLASRRRFAAELWESALDAAVDDFD